MNNSIITVKLYVTLNYGIRRPTYRILMNDDLIVNYIETVTGKLENSEKIEIEFSYFGDNALQKLKFEHIGKTDQDLIIVDNKIIVDHFIKIDEVELNKIQLNSALLTASTFYHTMDVSWVAHMKQQGFDIADSYSPGTDLNLNGYSLIEFELPIWQWWCEQLQAYTI
jgi:hypothetical protein